MTSVEELRAKFEAATSTSNILTASEESLIDAFEGIARDALGLLESPLVLGTFETRHFTWTALGRNESEVNQALLAVYAAHCQQIPEAEPMLMRDAIVHDEVRYTTMRAGVGLRDDEEVVHHAPYLTVTRETQEADTLYALPDGGYFVSPDGEGRFWFDTLAEVVEQYGESHGMPTVHLSATPED